MGSNVYGKGYHDGHSQGYRLGQRDTVRQVNEQLASRSNAGQWDWLTNAFSSIVVMTVVEAWKHRKTSRANRAARQ